MKDMRNIKKILHEHWFEEANFYSQEQEYHDTKQTTLLIVSTWHVSTGYSIEKSEHFILNNKDMTFLNKQFF